MFSKKGIGIASSLLITMALISGLTVMTSTPEPHYKGTCDTWYENNIGGEWIRSYAKIVSSRWRIYTSLSGVTFFRLRFTELNVFEQEQEEPGTYDDFIVRMRADCVVEVSPGVISITGISHWWKNGVRKDWDDPTTITIAETKL